MISGAYDLNVIELVGLSKDTKPINDYIKKYHCEEISINISFMNILDACHITTICSTTHFIKYPNGKINWIISSELVEELNKDLGLGNCNYTL